MQPLIIPCATEADWQRERTLAIGASEAAALVGKNPYLTPLQLWSRKKLALPDSVAETEAMTAGKFMEDGNARWYEHANKRQVITPQEFYDCPGAFAVIVRHPFLPLQCTPDRIIVDHTAPAPIHARHGVWQGKNVSAWLADAWEDGENVAPPLHVQIQVQVEMLCTGLSWGAIAGVIGGNKRRDADVTAHAAFQEKLGRMAVAFWTSLTTDLAPAATAGDLEEIARMYPKSVPGLSKELERPELVMEFARAKALAKRYEEQADALKAALEQEIGPAETLTVGGKKVATWKTTTRNDPPREARTVEFRTLRLDSSITKAAEAALPSHEPYPILPA